MFGLTINIMDTTHLEYTAEDLIAHKLQRAGLLVSKPKFDREGTDLIALLKVNDGAKFCRIQCKGRSLKNSDHTNVTVPVEYVKGAFCLFLYIDKGDDATNLYCFFPEDFQSRWEIRISSKNQRKCYYLYIHSRQIKCDITKYIFNKSKIDKLKNIISKSNSKKEIELFHLIEYQEELIALTKEKNDLERCLAEIKYLEKSIKDQNEIIEGRIKRFELICNNLLKELPAQLVDKIRLYKANGKSEQEVAKELSRNAPENISKIVLEYAISYIFDSYRSKL